VSALELPRADRFYLPGGASLKADIDCEQSTLQPLRDGYVFCIVGPCPAQLVCKAPGKSPEPTVKVPVDRHRKKPIERDLGELTRNRATPHHLMKRGRDLRPQKRRRNEVIASQKVEALLRNGRLDDRTRVDGEGGQCPILDRRTALTTLGIGSPVAVLNHSRLIGRVSPPRRSSMSASSVKCCVPTLGSLRAPPASVGCRPGRAPRHRPSRSSGAVPHVVLFQVERKKLHFSRSFLSPTLRKNGARRALPSPRPPLLV